MSTTLENFKTKQAMEALIRGNTVLIGCLRQKKSYSMAFLQNLSLKENEKQNTEEVFVDFSQSKPY